MFGEIQIKDNLYQHNITYLHEGIFGASKATWNILLNKNIINNALNNYNLVLCANKSTAKCDIQCNNYGSWLYNMKINGRGDSNNKSNTPLKVLSAFYLNIYVVYKKKLQTFNLTKATIKLKSLPTCILTSHHDILDVCNMICNSETKVTWKTNL